MSEWIKWEGGECPVAWDVLIDVKFGGGSEVLAYSPSRLFWRSANDGSFGEIVAYRLSTQEEAYEETDKPIDGSVLAVQIGGDHYKNLKIQPVEFVNANEMDFLQGSVVKYISRHKLKGGKVDVEKAIHFCKMILELQYADKAD